MDYRHGYSVCQITYSYFYKEDTHCFEQSQQLKHNLGDNYPLSRFYMNFNVTFIIIVFFVIINLVSFFAMGIDKRRAINHAWRIPEATLFLFAILGGSIGSIIGMKVFRHKTKHWYFVVGMPLILIIQVSIIIFIHLKVTIVFM